MQSFHVCVFFVLIEINVYAHCVLQFKKEVGTVLSAQKLISV